MSYWLMKSEPGAFSIDDLARAKSTGWDGVRNYQARNLLRSMKPGDRALFYHSNAQPSAVVGWMKVLREAYPDGPGASSPWVKVDVQFGGKFARPVTLNEIKAARELKEMVLLRNSRLSVQPVTPEEWSSILHMGGAS